MKQEKKKKNVKGKKEETFKTWCSMGTTGN